MQTGSFAKYLLLWKIRRLKDIVMDVSVVIPVKNGGNLLDEVLDAVYAQKTKYSYEVICVDSGSSDNSIEIIKKHGANLYEIKPEEFGHGKTRNFGASKGTGEFIVFITQDAKPYDENWLQNFIDAMKVDQQIAGAFGKHYPYPGCNLPDKNMLENHFKGFGEDITIYSLKDEDKERYFSDAGYRGYLGFFSDNNSCLRRSVWEKIPYDDVNFAEDQFWACKILEAGYKKAYTPFAAVYHSHNYDLKSYKKRYFDEYKALYSVYQVVLSDGFAKYWRGILAATRYDCSYIKRQNISFSEKLKWYCYSFRRNHYKFYSAKKAVEYFSLDDAGKKAMDNKFSQQLLMIKK